MPKIAFVILHYNATEETVKCVNSIIEYIDNEEYKIIVVDNHSTNDSGRKLDLFFNNEQHIFILHNDENLGFARGNNIGIEYARSIFHADFVCCLNNDTEFIQKDFTQILYDEYKKSEAGVIAPLVYLKNGSIQKRYDKLLSISDYEHETEAWNLIIRHYVLYRIKLWIAGIVCKVHKKRKSYTNILLDDEYFMKPHFDIILHGCCLIFTPIFFEHLDGFSDETFLFHEEEILFLDTFNSGIHTLYFPRLYIKHMEDAATNTVVRTRREKEQFLAKHNIRSLNVLIRKMKEYNLNINE